MLSNPLNSAPDIETEKYRFSAIQTYFLKLDTQRKPQIDLCMDDVQVNSKKLDDSLGFYTLTGTEKKTPVCLVSLRSPDFLRNGTKVKNKTRP